MTTGLSGLSGLGGLQGLQGLGGGPTFGNSRRPGRLPTDLFAHLLNQQGQTQAEMPTTTSVGNLLDDLDEQHANIYGDYLRGKLGDPDFEFNMGRDLSHLEGGGPALDPARARALLEMAQKQRMSGEVKSAIAQEQADYAAQVAAQDRDRADMWRDSRIMRCATQGPLRGVIPDKLAEGAARVDTYYDMAGEEIMETSAEALSIFYN